MSGDRLWRLIGWVYPRSSKLRERSACFPCRYTHFSRVVWAPSAGGQSLCATMRPAGMCGVATRRHRGAIRRTRRVPNHRHRATTECWQRCVNLHRARHRNASPCPTETTGRGLKRNRGPSFARHRAMRVLAPPLCSFMPVGTIWGWDSPFQSTLVLTPEPHVPIAHPMSFQIQTGTRLMRGLLPRRRRRQPSAPSQRAGAPGRAHPHRLGRRRRRRP
jgi:hypothetical protein